MNKKFQCSVCNKLLPQKSFWTHKADDRDWKTHGGKEYRHHKCGECCYKTIDWNNINTILNICEEFDVPYIEKDLRKLTDRFGYSKLSLGRYLNIMRLCSYYGLGFKDTQQLIEIEKEKAIWNQKNVEKR